MKKIKWFNYKIIICAITFLPIIITKYMYFPNSEYGNVTFFALLIFIAGIIFLLPYIVDKIFCCLSIFMMLFYYIGQYIYHQLFEQYIYISTFANLFDEGVKYANEAIILFEIREIFIIIFGILCIIVIIILKSSRHIWMWKNIIISVVIGLILMVSANLIQKTTLVKIQESMDDIFLYNESDKYIYDTVISKTVFVEKFGMEQFLYKDIITNILVDKAQKEASFLEIEQFLSQNIEYKKNEYTDLFANKSLFLIEAESLTKAAIDEKLTPTLYYLMTNGWDFKGFNSPLLAGSTSDAETMINLSILPINDGTITSQRYADNYFPTTLAKGFKSMDYDITAYHNNYGLYYNRDNYFPALGYDLFMDAFDIGTVNQASDLEVQNIMSWVPVFNEKSYNFWITYSGHQPYSIAGLVDGPEYPESVVEEYKGYLEVVEQFYPDLPDDAKLYLAKNMSTDNAIKTTIEVYAMMDRIDDLVLIIYGDHYAKGFSKETINALQSNLDVNGEVTDTPLIIWANEINPMIIDKPCTSIDVMPTIFNLFGINYNKNNILGNDIFDERYRGFRFDSAWNITTMDYYYEFSSNSFSDLKISEEQAKKQVQRYLDYQNISNLIIKDNYYEEENE